MDLVKDYKDDEMKRNYYMAQINYSVITTFENLNLVNMECEIFKHRAGLSPE